MFTREPFAGNQLAAASAILGFFKPPIRSAASSETDQAYAVRQKRHAAVRRADVRGRDR